MTRRRYLRDCLAMLAVWSVFCAGMGWLIGNLWG